LQNLSFATPNPLDLRVSLALAKREWNNINDYADAKLDCVTKILEDVYKIEACKYFVFAALKIIYF
jgi:hypothetical protein